jgi:CheY-like chemotaxis protein
MGLWGTRVLVVDRDTETAHIIRGLMQSTGADVVGVASGGEALASLVGTLPDVLLIDVAAGGREGFDTMEEVRRLSPEKGGRIPSASMGPSLLNDHLLDDWRRAGFQLHVSKPFDAFELAAVVETLAGRFIERRRATSGPPERRQERERRASMVL